jgi:hypothetical protein
VPSAVAVKALLINSAVIDPNAAKQFNDSLSPWNARRGWGYMRLGTLPGLLQRTDGKEVCESSLPANPYPSACVLGSLAKKDEVNFYEGSIDGPFKATLVWNRHFTNAVLALDPLELSLYHKQGQTFAKIVVNNDKTLNGNTPKDNVQQVEVTEKNDVLVKVKLPAALVTGVTQERYGLAFSMALKPVAKPSLGVSCVVPPNPPSLQKVAVTCSASNAGGLPVFGAAASSSSGTASPVTLGTISAGGNATFTVNLTAPAVSDPALSVIVKVSGSLAGDSYTASGAFTLAPTATDCPIPITSLATPITLPAAGGTYSDSVTGLPSGCKWLVRVDSGTNFLSVAWSGMPTAAPGAFTFTAVPNGTLQIRGGVIEVWAVNNLNNPSESAFIFIAQEFQAGLGVAR